MLSGHGASIVNLRQQDEQYFCAATTKLIDKDFEFRSLCVRIQTIENIKNNMFDGLCTIEIKVCEIGSETAFYLEESNFKKLKKTVIVGDKTGALERSLWEPNFDKLKCAHSFVQCHLKEVKVQYLR